MLIKEKLFISELVEKFNQNKLFIYSNWDKINKKIKNNINILKFIDGLNNSLEAILET